MQVRKIVWTPDGWPLLSPQPYTGEMEQEISVEDISGRFERITFTPSLPQGIQTAVPMKLRKDGYYENCSIQGKWSKTGRNKFEINYGPHKEICIGIAVWDHEKNKQTLALTGISKEGICFWAKKVGEL